MRILSSKSTDRQLLGNINDQCLLHRHRYLHRFYYCHYQLHRQGQLHRHRVHHRPNVNSLPWETWRFSSSVRISLPFPSRQTLGPSEFLRRIQRYRPAPFDSSSRSSPFEEDSLSDGRRARTRKRGRCALWVKIELKEADSRLCEESA